jgi:hypothetical protein
LYWNDGKAGKPAGLVELEGDIVTRGKLTAVERTITALRIGDFCPEETKGAWRESQAPSDLNQYVRYLRDHLLLDKCVD